MSSHVRGPRVLMFSEQYRPIVGGAERQVELLAGTLHDRGVPTTVLTVRRDPTVPQTEIDDRGVRIIRIPYDQSPRPGGDDGSTRLRWVAAVCATRIAFSVARLAREFDILHAHNASSPLTAIAVRVARARGLRTVVKAVNSREWFDLRILERRPLAGRTAKRWLVHDVDRWVATASVIADDLAAEGVPRSRICTIGNGVRIPPTTREIGDVARRFLHVGRLARTAPRDVAGMIAAFGAIASRHAGLELVIVGGGDQSAAIAGIAAALPAVSQIRLVGEGPPEPWWAWADCLIQPSFAEGMSNALLEGMAAGLACVAYDIPSNREALLSGNAGALVPVGDVAALERALEGLAVEPGLARRLGSLGRKRATEVYSIESIADSLTREYSAILAA